MSTTVLLDAAVDHRLQAVDVIMLMLMLGLRPGDVLGLAWDAVNLDNGEISVPPGPEGRTGPPKVVIGPLKTVGSRRALAVPQQAQDALRAHGQRQVEECFAAATDWVETGLVLTTCVGTAIDPRNFRRSFAA